MRIMVLVSSVVFIFFMLCGCDSHRPTDGFSNGVPVFEANPSTILAKVNGTPITVADYLARYRFESTIYTCRHKTTQTMDALPVSRTRFLSKRAPLILPELINQLLVRQYLDDNALALTEQVSRKTVAQTLRAFKYSKDLDDFSKEFGFPQTFLKEQILFSKKLELARDSFAEETFAVNEQEIDDGLARLNRIYEHAISSNAVTYLAASNLCRRIVNEHLDFEKTGSEVGQHEPEEAKYWECMEASEIENEEMRNWAFTAPVGSVGGPFDLADGLSIVKILARTNGQHEDSYARIQAGDVTLARITFYMLVPEPEPRTREYVGTALLKWKQGMAQKKLIEVLNSRADIVYPHGNKFSYCKEVENEK